MKPLKNKKVPMNKNSCKYDDFEKRKHSSVIKKTSHHQNDRTQRQSCMEGRRCTLSKRRSPTPKREDLLSTKRIERFNKNHVSENISQVKNWKCLPHPPIVQDTCNGHRQDAERAGLRLKYVFKKNYGKTPRYIHRRRLEQKNEYPVEGSCCEIPKTRTISDEEKQMVLSGLKKNLREVEKLLLSLPVIIDTISKQKRKIELENRLNELQQDIEMLEKNNVIVIKED